MEVMGMTDLQFKGFIKLLIRQLEEARSQDEKGKIQAELDKVMKDLQDMLEG